MTPEGQTSDLRDLVARDGAALVEVAALLTGDLHAARQIVLEALAAAGDRAPGAVDRAFVRGEVLALARRFGTRSVPPYPTPPDATPDRTDPGAREAAAPPQAVVAALARLPEREREALVLRCVHGLDDDDVAEALAVPVRSARAWADWAASDLLSMLPVSPAGGPCAALRAAAPGAEGPRWDEVEARARQLQAHRRRARSTSVALLGLVLVLVAAALASGASRGDGRRLRDAPRGPAFVPGAPPGPTGEQPDMAVPAGLQGVWPIVSQEDLDLHLSSASTAYDEPAPTAQAFLREYVGMPRAEVSDPQVVPPSATTSWQQVTFSAVAAPGAGARMRVTVAEIAADGPWTVTALTSNDLVVQQPVAGDVITAPTAVEGSASTASGTLVIEVRALGATAPLGSAIATATPGGLASFSQTVDFAPGPRPVVAVVVYEQSTGDGTPVQAVVVAVQLAP